MRTKTCAELQELCAELRREAPAQADVLDIMLQITKAIPLSDLLAKTEGSRSPVDTLVKKGILQLKKVRSEHQLIEDAEYLPAKAKTLNEEQLRALEKISASIEGARFETHLVHGVTGSGKTEVYIQAIQKTVTLGKGVVVLVPEIALTTQTIERFKSRFSEPIAILHHRLSDGERFHEWNKIASGSARIVIGARSALFCPIKNLGLIVVDEEHDSSYKQCDEMPCYHARDVAVMRASFTKATVILGSATPSLESYYNVEKKKYNLSTLQTRADAALLPKVTIVDMKREHEKAQRYTNFSDTLLDGIKKRISLGEQTILFLNRRGYHTSMVCTACGSTLKCAHCDVALTFHRGDNWLSCHLCGFALHPAPSSCPLCAAPQTLKYKGVGTEQVEASLHAILGEIRTLRIDGDTTRHKGSHQKLFRAFATGKADVLIGTQMITKGLHFPAVTLVGVLNSDTILNLPDFRSSEITFQLITQVAGRAGRGAISGEVIIQTSIPENKTIQLAATQDYCAFYKEEMASRALFSYPPYSQFVKIIFSGLQQEQVQETAEELRNQLVKSLPNTYEAFPVQPAGYPKVRDHYYFQFIVRGAQTKPISQAMMDIFQNSKKNPHVRIRVDVNPLSTF